MKLIAFFALTFALSWTIFFSVDHRGGTHPLFLIGVFAPSIAALLLTWHAEGRDGVRRLLAPIARWDVPIQWYLFAISYMAIVKAAAAVVVRVSTSAWPELDANAIILPVAIAVSTPVQAGEEVGWRGYALPRMSLVMGVRIASVVLGLIWALWHLPLFYVAGADTTGQSFAVYAAQVTALSVAITWLFERTRGSLLLVMLMHSSINQVTAVLSARPAPSAHPWTLNASLLSWATLLLLWIGAVYFILRMPDTREIPEPRQSPAS